MVSDLAYDEIARARIGGREPIPLLSDLLTAWPHAKLNIDAKSDRAIEPLARCIDEHRAWDRVCVASFSRAAAAPAPGAARPAGRDGVLRRSAWPACGCCRRTACAPSRRPSGLAAQVPPRRGRFEVVTQRLRRPGARARASRCTSGRSTTPTRCTGCSTSASTAIMTDRTDLLRDVFALAGIWRESQAADDRPDRRPVRLRAAQRAARLVLLRLGQLGVRHHGRDRPVRAVPDLGRGAGRLRAAGTDENPCTADLAVLGLGVSPGSLVFYVVTVATIVSALILPVVGAAGRPLGRSKKPLMAGFAWAGQPVRRGDVPRRRDGLAARGGAAVAGQPVPGRRAWSSTTRSCARSPRPDERDRVSSRGWAFGYLGGGLLLAVNLVRGARPRRVRARARRWRCGSACSAPAVWWAAFTVIPYRGLRTGRRSTVVRRAAVAWSGRASASCWTTLREHAWLPDDPDCSWSPTCSSTTASRR